MIEVVASDCTSAMLGVKPLHTDGRLLPRWMDYCRRLKTSPVASMIQQRDLSHYHILLSTQHIWGIRKCRMGRTRGRDSVLRSLLTLTPSSYFLTDDAVITVLLAIASEWMLQLGLSACRRSAHRRTWMTCSQRLWVAAPKREDLMNLVHVVFLSLWVSQPTHF